MNTGPADRIEAGPFTLRPPQPADVAWIYDACQDPEISRWTRVPSPYRAADAVAFHELATRGWSDRVEFHFMITLTESGELLGACALHHLDLSNRTAEIGYWLESGAVGAGVATASVNALAAWAHQQLDLAVLEALVMRGNVRSEAVLSRCGFQLVSRHALCGRLSGDVPASRWRRELGR